MAPFHHRQSALEGDITGCQRRQKLLRGLGGCSRAEPEVDEARRGDCRLSVDQFTIVTIERDDDAPLGHGEGQERGIVGARDGVARR